MNQEAGYPEIDGTFVGDYTDAQEYADYAEEEPAIPLPPPETPMLHEQEEVTFDEGIANILDVIKGQLKEDIDRTITYEIHNNSL